MNGRSNGDDGSHPADGLDDAVLEALDDAPLDADEAALAAERAGEPVGETLAEVVGRVVGELGASDLTGGEAMGETTFATGGTVFAILPGVANAQVLDVALDGSVTRASLATPDTSASPRGAGWVRFAPQVMDRYAADRAEAWIRFAHRRAGEAR